VSTTIPLGRFEKVGLRKAWPSEAGNFTPWLALSENLKLLGDALNLGELQDQQTEVRVGDFLIDILAVDGNGDAVIIENQLEQTDHKHLGQLLTYLAGQDGKASLVWIAEDFREEHRAVIDWLNRNTVEGYEFFGVEIELWRIGDSPPAPRFKLVAQPNEWAKSVRSVAREASDPELAERHRIRLAYWQSFAEFLKKQHSSFKINRAIRTGVYQFPMHPGFRILARVSIGKQLVSIGLAISRDPDRSKFRALLAQRAAIEKEFGEALVWDEKFGTKRSLTSVTRHSVDIANSEQYESIHRWMLDRMDRFSSAFGARIVGLPLNSEQDEDSSED
jgi:Domain of unknown function (DUF4268)